MSDSLKKEAEKLLIQNNPTFENSYRNILSENINNHKKWYIIFFIILIIFILPCFISIPFLGFIHFEQTNLNNIIHQRTGNIVTMVSVTFAIIGFLIANLAIKESFTYNILFKKSGFFPVVFAALSLIVCFIALSTFSDWLPGLYLSNALLVGTYLIFVIVFLIGYLFTKLIRFTNQKFIFDLIRKEFILESKKNLVRIGTTVISHNKIRELGFNIFSTYMDIEIQSEFNLKEGHNVISDIRINKLQKKAKKIVDKKKIFVNDIYLQKNIENNENGFFYVEEGDYQSLKKDLKDLNNCIITSKKNEENIDEAKEYILQKLGYGVKINDDKMVESYFDILFEIYKLQQTFKI